LYRSSIRPKSWWTAQALLYDFSVSKNSNIGAIRTSLEGAIKTNALVVPKRIMDLEAKANRDFKKLNKEVLAKTGAGTFSTVQGTKGVVDKGSATGKANGTGSKPKPAAINNAPKAKEANQSANPTQNQVEVKARTKQTAKRSGPLFDLPPSKRAKVEREDGGLGPSGSAQLSRNAVTPMTTAVDNASNSKETSQNMSTQSQVDAKPRFRTKQTARRGGGPSRFPPSARNVTTPVDGVAGFYAITCDYITQEWDYCDDLSLNAIYTAPQRMEADFDFGIAAGFIRSKTVEKRTDGGVYVTFEWVGQERDGPVLTPNKSHSGYFKFEKMGKDGVPTLKGRIQGLPACGKDGVEFTGEWMQPPDRNRNSWNDYNEEAYERANRARWHR
jgi:hypothetical protein